MTKNGQFISKNAKNIYFNSKTFLAVLFFVAKQILGTNLYFAKLEHVFNYSCKLFEPLKIMHAY